MTKSFMLSSPSAPGTLRRRSRGRPPRAGYDCIITPELARKHARGETLEPLDFCLREGWISEAQHRAGIRLRWLYGKLVGVPAPTTTHWGATQWSNAVISGGMPPSGTASEEDWSREYYRYTFQLRQSGCLALVLRVCVMQQAPASEYELEQLKQGLALLVTLGYQAQLHEQGQGRTH